MLPIRLTAMIIFLLFLNLRFILYSLADSVALHKVPK